MALIDALIRKITLITFSGTTPKEVYKEITEFLRYLEENIEELPFYSGRGIVISFPPNSGNIKESIIIARALRKLNCTLPIHVYYELKTDWVPEKCLLDLSSKLDVSLIPFSQNLTNYILKMNNHYIWKVLAMVFCPFHEVLLLDIDNLPLRNVDYLFEEAKKLDVTGLFWHDIQPLQPSNPMFSLHGSSQFSKWALTQESAQVVVVKKTQAIISLFLAVMMNIHHQYTYPLIYPPIIGDKDTFAHSWIITKSPYVFLPPPRIGGMRGACSKSQIPRSFDGRAVFWHHNGMKYHGIREWKNVLGDGLFTCREFDDKYSLLIHSDANCLYDDRFPSRITNCTDLMPEHIITPANFLLSVLELLEREGHGECLA